ncbi:MAG: MFS family permease [Candidatus Azotimanducaceae bacterium]|jgi:MFS family permease
MMIRSKLNFLFLNVGHFLDHLFILIFATASLHLMSDWEMSYAELIPYATPGFVAYGVCAIPAGWLADKWSREGMMAIFFIGIGACSILTSTANTPLGIAVCLTLVGIFASIYHPVGLAMVIQDREKTGLPLAINGIFGNMGVACAALFTGYLIDSSGWRSAFIVPGILSIVIGGLYLLFIRTNPTIPETAATTTANVAETKQISRQLLIRFFSIILFTTAIGGFIFQSTTFGLPKIFDERLTELTGTATLLGWYVFLVFSLAALAQLVVGFLVDRYEVRTVFTCVALLQSGFFLFMIQLEGVLALLVAVAFMLVVFGQIPINDVLVGRIARTEWRSRAYALRYLVTFSVMASALPLISWIHASWGFDLLFAVLSGAALAIFTGALCLPTTKKPLASDAIAPSNRG